MKKTLLSFVILSIVFVFSSCKQDVEKLIIGSWDNTSTEVEKIDEVAKSILDANINYLQQQKSVYESQLKTMDDSTKAIYQQIIDNMNSQLSTLNVILLKTISFRILKLVCLFSTKIKLLQ